MDLVNEEASALQARVLKLEPRVAALLVMVRLMLVRLHGLRLNGERLPEGTAKATVLQAVARARPVVGPDTALRLLGLSKSRTHGWQQAQRQCGSDDVSSCPKSTPMQLTSAEVSAMHEMATQPQYRHVPTHVFATLAQRLGRVYASATT